MKIALDPRYVHGGFEAQSTGKVAFNRVLRFGSLQRRASMSPTYVAHKESCCTSPRDSARRGTYPSDLPSVNSGIAGASGEWFCKFIYGSFRDHIPIGPGERTAPFEAITNASADDLEDLRRALGVERLSLLGHSYGTSLALTLHLRVRQILLG